MNDSNFETRVQNFHDEIVRRMTAHYTKNLPNLDVPDVVPEDGSSYIRFFETRSGQSYGGSVLAFVAKKDKTTKSMGVVRRGDVFKPATWRAPAKHRRGNIFESDGGFSALTHDGRIRYL